MSYRVGVDLGTTFTAAAVANGSRPPCSASGTGPCRSPRWSILAAGRRVRLSARPPSGAGLAEPDRVAREFKRRIGDTVPILVAGSPYSAQALTARLLRHVWSDDPRQEGVRARRRWC